MSNLESKNMVYEPILTNFQLRRTSISRRCSMRPIPDRLPSLPVVVLLRLLEPAELLQEDTVVVVAHSGTG